MRLKERNAAIIPAALCGQHAACLLELGDDDKATVESCLGQMRTVWGPDQNKNES